MFGLGKRIKELRSTNAALRRVAEAQERLAAAQQKRLAALVEREHELYTDGTPIAPENSRDLWWKKEN